MEIAKIEVNRTLACVSERCREPVTSGMVGAEVSFTFSEEWAQLHKTAVFRAGAVVRDVENIGAAPVRVPAEVLAKSGVRLHVGVYGTDDAGSVVIPTVYAELGLIAVGADPSGEPGRDPGLPIWKVILNQIGDLDDLDTEARESLVAAINEALTKGNVSAEEIAEAVAAYLLKHPLSESDPTVPKWAKEPQKPRYTASEVGAATPDYVAQQLAALPDVNAMFSAHNTSGTCHRDIRQQLSQLGTRLSALADSDDETLDQLSEIVAYIKSNKSLIDAITTAKVSVTDIVDSLTSSDTAKPLSANQGRVLKELIDAIEVPAGGGEKAWVTLLDKKVDDRDIVYYCVDAKGYTEFFVTIFFANDAEITDAKNGYVALNCGGESPWYHGVNISGNIQNLVYNANNNNNKTMVYRFEIVNGRLIPIGTFTSANNAASSRVLVNAATNVCSMLMVGTADNSEVYYHTVDEVYDIGVGSYTTYFGVGSKILIMAR